MSVPAIQQEPERGDVQLLYDAILALANANHALAQRLDALETTAARTHTRVSFLEGAHQP